MAPSQLNRTETDAPDETELNALSATIASALARSTFFPRPMTKREKPSRKSFSVSFRFLISSAIVLYRTIGPAMSCGKKEMYRPTFRMFFCTSPSLR